MSVMQTRQCVRCIQHVNLNTWSLVSQSGRAVAEMSCRQRAYAGQAIGPLAAHANPGVMINSGMIAGPCCRERLAKLQAAARPEEAEETFSPATNERSARMALSKQIRELHDELPAYERLGGQRCPAPMHDHGERTLHPVLPPANVCLPWSHL